MANRPPEIIVSTGLLEKLAGLKKPEPAKPAAPRAPLQSIQLPARPGISQDAARFIAQDKQITRQLQTAKEVSGLLLKAEASELQLVTQKAEELLRKHSVPVKTQPCQMEAQACTQCFQEHAKEAWRCADAAEAYRLCAVQAFSASRANIGAAPAASG